MSQLPNIEALSLKSPASPGGTAKISKATGNRLPPVMKKYMNAGLVRPPNTGLASLASASSNNANTAYQEAQRGPLMKLAGVPRQSKSPASPRALATKQYTAHGIHGPAHATSSRAAASSIAGPTNHQPIAAKKFEFGQYDGGLEADAEVAETVGGEAARLLEMDSSAGHAA